MGIACRNRIVAFARIVCTVRCNTPDLFVWWDLVEQIREHRRITNAAAGCLDCTYFQCFLIDTDMYLAPEAAFRPAMLTRIPLTFTLRFDACAVYQKVQRPR
jgi:hypothetical protein